MAKEGEEEEKDVTPKEVKTAVDAMREKVEKYGAESAEAKEMIAKTNETLEKSEKQHQEAIGKMKESEKKALDQDERIKDLETEMVKKSVGPANLNYRESDEYKSLQKVIVSGEKGFSAEEYKELRMDTGTAGGYLTTTEMDNELIKTIEEISPVRQISRVKTVSAKTLEIAKRTSIPRGTYEGEAVAGGKEQSTYANESMTCYRQTVTVGLTLDVLNDAQFDLMSEVNSDVKEGMAIGEGLNFVSGDGVKKPEGFLANAEVIASPSTTIGAGVISGDDLLLLAGQLKVGYNPLYGFNRQTLALLRTLKGSNGQYLWQNTLVPGAPNTIGGNPYVVIQDMPIVATNSLSVIYGDFLRGYRITDRTGMSIIRDDLTFKKEAIIELTFHRYNTGQVVLAEAFKVLKTQ